MSRYVRQEITITPEPSDGRCRPRSAATKEKLSAALKGRKIPAEWRAKITASQTGLKRDAAFSEALSKRWKGRKFSEETKAKMRKAKLGKPLSLEHRQKLALAQQQRRKEDGTFKDRLTYKRRSGFEA